MTVTDDIAIIRNKIQKPIVLVGMMGAGKTTIGRSLAHSLSRPFYDSDNEIEKKTGKSVAEIFAEDGEPAFRNFERDTIAHLLSEGPAVIATGGGAIATPQTADLIFLKSICCWLDAPIDLLILRTRDSDRPLLKQGDPKTVLTKLLEKRQPAYARAPIHILGEDSESHEDTTKRLLRTLAQYAHKPSPSSP